MKTFVDTNYFLCFLVKDNEEQSLKAKSLLDDGKIEKVKLFSSTIVFFEIYWVLVSSYEVENAKAMEILSKILEMDFVEFKERKLLQSALDLYGENNLELEDCYNIAYAIRFDKEIEIATFDIKLQKAFKMLKASQ